ncbi:hypothetical protein M23134_05861 [Microscilla marina ATCC 23134]|uniref:Uncharacterized protein n=1 Tax=Microscilla marina ATCC 23134 TaxID=313606 RepID=A1ZXL1_MICM2|nr:hypothetical protein M23134_05861 [Microscilla marina ATCC 23134]
MRGTLSEKYISAEAKNPTNQKWKVGLALGYKKFLFCRKPNVYFI